MRAQQGAPTPCKTGLSCDNDVAATSMQHVFACVALRLLAGAATQLNCQRAQHTRVPHAQRPTGRLQAGRRSRCAALHHAAPPRAAHLQRAVERPPGAVPGEGGGEAKQDVAHRGGHQPARQQHGGRGAGAQHAAAHERQRGAQAGVAPSQPLGATAGAAGGGSSTAHPTAQLRCQRARLPVALSAAARPAAGGGGGRSVPAAAPLPPGPPPCHRAHLTNLLMP